MRRFHPIVLIGIFCLIFISLYFSLPRTILPLADQARGILISFLKPAQAQFNPDQYGNIHGFIWTDTLGLISTNCNNDFDGDSLIEETESQCMAGAYGITINEDLSITGFAWSETIGLVCFGASCGLETPPGPPLGEGGIAQAKIDENGIVSGWAQVKNLSEEDGWISLRGTTLDGINFSVEIDFSSGRWFEHGWNRHPDGTGLGWLDFGNVTTTFAPTFECENEGETLPCGSNVGECKPGIKTCSNGFWSVCKGGIGPQAEICDGKDNDCDWFIDEGCPDASPDGGCLPSVEVCDAIDNNCNGLIDELAACQFQVRGPQGIYEPLCQNADGQAVFCDGPNKGKKLVGTHLHQFKIEISNVKAPAGTVISCKIQKDSNILELSGLSDEQGTVVLKYTLKPEDGKEISFKPWRLVECQLGTGHPQAVNQPIFVHQNTWTELSKTDQDMYRAYDCWLGQKERYFLNEIRCDFEGDYAFVRSMARGVPIEGDCSDGVDNDGNGLIDCADRWCKGISYQCLPQCPTGIKSTAESPCREQL